jgi:hypothetical protein
MSSDLDIVVWRRRLAAAALGGGSRGAALFSKERRAGGTGEFPRERRVPREGLFAVFSNPLGSAYCLRPRHPMATVWRESG